jgi:hypothetical protein
MEPRVTPGPLNYRESEFERERARVHSGGLYFESAGADSLGL